MSTDNNVIQFPGATYEGVTCTCGSAWFDGTVCVAVGGDDCIHELANAIERVGHAQEPRRHTDDGTE